MRVMLWHVHGSWTDAFVRGRHRYLLPWSPGGGPWGLGRAGRRWPHGVEDVPFDALAGAEADLVVLQRPDEVEMAERLLGLRPGRDIPAVYVEHNTPRGDAATTRHPLADQADIPIVHVTHFNRLMWDCGSAKTLVIEHGVVDPGPLYRGTHPHLGVVVNEPVRRWRVAGSDLLPAFAEAAPLDVFGMGGDALPDSIGLGPDRLRVHGDLPMPRLHRRLADCRAYLHPMRWTSLGLSLIEAMHLGLPVIALAATEAVRAVPPEAGVISTRVDELVAAARRFIADPDLAHSRGAAARAHALEHYGLAAFLDRWDELIADIAEHPHRAGRRMPVAQPSVAQP